jgi:hypothetical protein
MPTNSFKSEGARIERKAILSRVRRLAKLEAEAGHDYIAEAFDKLAEWILERRKRYEAKPGGLGRK